MKRLFTKLAKPTSPKWTAEKREKWHQALTAMLDLYIKIDDDNGLSI